jgi:hypothetical protein
LAASKQIATATVEFFRDGLEKNRAASATEWIDEFLPVWAAWIGRLAPLIKYEAFKAENEYRIVHQLQNNENGRNPIQAKADANVSLYASRLSSSVRTSFSYAPYRQGQGRTHPA